MSRQRPLKMLHLGNGALSRVNSNHINFHSYGWWLSHFVFSPVFFSQIYVFVTYLITYFPLIIGSPQQTLLLVSFSYRITTSLLFPAVDRSNFVNNVNDSLAGFQVDLRNIAYLFLVF